MRKENTYSIEIFKSIFENLTESIWIIKNDRVIISNKSACELFGISSEDEIRGMSIWDYSPKHQLNGLLSKSLGLQYLAKAANNEKPVFQWQHQKKDGEPLELEVMLSRFDFEEGIYILAVFHNIIDRRGLEKELVLVKEKAEKNAQLKTQFLANMSHDIRNPLNAILGFSKILADDYNLTISDRKKYGALIESNGNKLLMLINDIIDVSLIEANKMKVERKRCEVNSILDELYLTFQKKIELRDNLRLKLNIAVDDPGFAIYSDPMRLRQILSNLIDNAIKYTQQGFVEFGYELIDDKSIQFFVKDSGVGIAPEHIEDIFNRFSREASEEPDGVRGTGLGLDISKHLVNLLKGKIWVFSTLNIGSEFYVNLPAEFLDYKPKVKNTKEKERSSSIHDVDWSDKHLLIAEDDSINFELLRIILSKTKVKISHAVNGLEAVNILKKDASIDLLLLDIQMPVMNGYEAAEEIRKLKPNLPVIAQTAVTLENFDRKSYADLFDACLSKPIDVKTMIEKIQKYFD